MNQPGLFAGFGRKLGAVLPHHHVAIKFQSEHCAAVPFAGRAAAAAFPGPEQEPERFPDVNRFPGLRQPDHDRRAEQEAENDITQRGM